MIKSGRTTEMLERAIKYIPETNNIIIIGATADQCASHLLPYFCELISNLI